VGTAVEARLPTRGRSRIARLELIDQRDAVSAPRQPPRE
jgi:hypothetical protein